MKLQLGTATLLLSVAFVAIVCASITAWDKLVSLSAGLTMPLSAHLHNFLMTSPYWVPFIVIGYALGRRQLSASMVGLFATFQAVALGTVYLIVQSR